MHSLSVESTCQPGKKLENKMRERNRTAKKSAQPNQKLYLVNCISMKVDFGNEININVFRIYNVMLTSELTTFAGQCGQSLCELNV